ncbi:MAG: hypothetical protein AAF823_06970 [Planctomycetota bacterium]
MSDQPAHFPRPADTSAAYLVGMSAGAIAAITAIGLPLFSNVCHQAMQLYNAEAPAVTRWLLGVPTWLFVLTGACVATGLWFVRPSFSSRCPRWLAPSLAIPALLVAGLALLAVSLPIHTLHASMLP